MDAMGSVGLKALEVGVLCLTSLLLGLSPLFLPRLAERYSESSSVLRQISMTLSRPASSCRLQVSRGLRCLTAGVLLASCLLDLLPVSARKIFNARKQLDLTSTFPLLEFFLSIGFFAMLLTEQSMLAWLESTSDQRVAEEEQRLQRARALYTLPTLTDLAPDGRVISCPEENLTHTNNVYRNYGALDQDGGHSVCLTETTPTAEDPSARRNAVDKLREVFRRQGVLMSRILLFQKILNRKTDTAALEMTEVNSTTRNSHHEEDTSVVDASEIISDHADLNVFESSKKGVGATEDIKVQISTDRPKVHGESRDDSDGNIFEMDPTAGAESSGIQATSDHENQDHHCSNKHSNSVLSLGARTSPSSRSFSVDNESTYLERDDETEPLTEQAKEPDQSKPPVNQSVASTSAEQPTSRFRHVVSSASQDGVSGRSESSVMSYSSSTEQSSHVVLNTRGDNTHVQSALRTTMLVAALCLHVFFQGLALTLTSTTALVLRFSVGLIFHRCMVSLSLGERLQVSQLSLTASVVSLVLFALASPLGFAIALGVGRWTSGGTGELVQGAMLGMACGTLLFLVLFEILPFELLGQDGERFVNLLCVILGYSSIALLLLLSPHQTVCVE